MGELSGLLNIGSKLEAQLHEVGIATAEQLKEIGSREAWLRIFARDPSAGCGCMRLRGQYKVYL